MAQSKREILKFIRIKVRPAHFTGDTDETTVSGYLNTYKEFSRWDVEFQQGFTSLTGTQQADFSYTPDGSTASVMSSAPKSFFVGRNSLWRLGQVGAGFGLDENSYRNLSFIINGVHEPYDRRKPNHDLKVVSSRIFVQDSSGRFVNWNGERRAYRGLEPAPLSLLFRINPTNIRIQKRKLFQKIRTRAGWVFQHWGPEIGQIDLRGTTGSTLLDPDIKLATKKLPLLGEIPLLTTLNDERPTELTSPALKAFKELERWYDEDQSEEAVERGFLTALEWRGRIYVGHLASFQIEERGDQPLQLFYNISFIVHYDSNHLQGAVTRASNQIVRNEKTLVQVKSLKGTTG